METTILFPSDGDTLSDKERFTLRPYAIQHSATGRHLPLSLIVAVGTNRAIGRDGDLLWHLRGDLRRFKALTMGHPVIMGRNTWDSLPKGALPGRRNIVLSRNDGFNPVGAERVSSLEEALSLCAGDAEPFIIGGAQVYAQALPWVTTMHLTLVDDAPADADTFFPEFDINEWEETDSTPGDPEEGRPSFRYVTLRRR